MNRIKHFMILALALAMSLGAWAQQEVLLTTINASSGFTNGTQTFDNIVTVTLDEVSYSANYGWYCPGSPHSVEVAPVNGVTVTGYMLYFSATDPIEFEGSSFEVALEGNRVLANDISTQLGSVGITNIEVYGYAADASTVTHNTDGSWGFTMPGYNAALNVTYYSQPDLAWTYNSADMPAEGLTAYRGFDSAFFAGLQLQMNSAFAAHFGGDVTHFDIPTSWAGQETLITPSDLPGFQPMTEAEAKAWTGVPATGHGKLLYAYNADNSQWTYLLYESGSFDNYPSTYTLQRGDVYDLHVSYGPEYYYTTAGSATLRYGSSDPSVVTIDANGHAQAVGAGTATLYAVFDGDDDFLYDSAYFTVNILDPDTLTLAANGNGTVSALLGGNATQFHAPADWNGQDTEYPTTEDFPGFLATTQEEAMALATGVSDNMAIVIYDQDSDDRWYYIIRNNDSYSPKLTNLAKQAFYACEESGTAIYYTTGGTDIVALVGQEGKYLVIPGTQVQVVAEAQDGNYVQAWSDNRQPQHYTSDTNTITVSGSMNLTATFAQNPLLTLASNNGGTVSLDGDSIGTVYTFTFEHSGNSEDDRAITIPANRLPYDTTFSYNANITFAHAYDQAGEGVSMITHGDDHHTVTVRISGPFEYGGYYSCELEGGDSDDWTISCTTGTGPVTPNGITKTGDNTYRVLPGTQLSVTATPGEGSYLAQWSDQTEPVEGNARLGSSHPYTMPATQATLTATFNEIPVLTLASNNSEWGTVELDGVTPGPTTYDITIEGGDTYTNVSFPFHTTVFLHEGLESVDAFDQNPLSAEQNGNSADITISESYGGGRTIEYGYFYNDEHGGGAKPIFCRAVEGLPIMPEGVVAYAGYGNYLVLPGTEVTVTATPDSAHYFVNWDEETARNSNTAVEKTLTMGTAPATLTANFATKPTLTLAQNDGGEMEIVPAGGVTAIVPLTYQIDLWESLYGGTLSENDLPAGLGFVAVDQAAAAAWTGVPASGEITLVYDIDGETFYYLSFNDGRLTGNDESLFSPGGFYDMASAGTLYITTGVTPSNVTATAEPNTYYIDYGTDVTVKATPSDTTYLVRFDTDDDTNSNVAVEKTYGPLTAALTTAEATFTAKPVLTLAQNESWGTVSVNGPVVWNNQVWGSWDYFNATFPQTIGDITINKYNFYCYYSYGKLLLDRNADNNSFVTFTSAGDNFTRIEMTYTAGTNLEPANEWTCANGVAVWEGNAQSVTITNADDFYITQIKFIRGSGVEQLTNNTYRVDYGTEVTVTADATALHHVQGWQDQNGTELTGATYSDYFITEPENLFPAKSALTLTVTGDTTARALFGINSYDVSASVAESDDVRGTVAIAYTDIDGAGQTTAAGASAEATAQGGSTSTLTATATDPGYHFVGWMDNLNTQSALNTQNPLTVTEAGSYTATFDTNSYQIGGSVAEGSTEWGSVTGSGEYRHFTTATLTALPIEHYHFVRWEDGNTQNPRIIDVTGEESHEAEFAIDRFIVEWSSNDETMGHVVGPYDNHTTGNPIPRLQGSYGTQFNLTASPAEHHMLDHWSTGQTTNVITVTITEDAEIVANFKHVPYSVSVASADETMGTVSGSQESVEWQASTEISATANYGYHFVRWNDGNTANPRTVTINEEHDYSFTAMFAKNQYTVTVVTGDATRGSVSGTTTVDYLTDVEISATANEHYHFEQWEDGNMQNPRTVTVTANATYRAYFAPDKYTVTGLADQGQGSVTGSGSYAYLSNAMLTAEPACGYLFDHWSNESTESTITFQVTGEMSYTAFFRPAVVETVEIHDTVTVTETVTVHDTTYIDIHDSIDVTVHVHDTTIVEVPVYVHDTTTVTVTEYVHDTTFVNVPVHDTVYVSDGTIIYVHDTTTVEVPVNVYVHDTTTIEVQVPVYVYDTTTVYDTTVVEVPVHDTTTVTEYEYIHDTVEVTVIVHDTIFIHDTIFVGIEGVDALDAKIYGNNGQIVVEGADFNEVILFDVNGRILARRQDEGLPLRFDIPASGAYLVKIGNHAARRIVMIR